jgi:hypothetical protein
LVFGAGTLSALTFLATLAAAGFAAGFFGLTGASESLFLAAGGLVFCINSINEAQDKLNNGYFFRGARSSRLGFKKLDLAGRPFGKREHILFNAIGDSSSQMRDIHLVRLKTIGIFSILQAYTHQSGKPQRKIESTFLIVLRETPDLASSG